VVGIRLEADIKCPPIKREALRRASDKVTSLDLPYSPIPTIRKACVAFAYSC